MQLLKLQLLKTHFRGETADMLKTIHIQALDHNFEIARKKLDDNYTNKRKLISMYVSNLLDLPSVASESLSELKSLLNGTINILSALEQLKRPVKQWDDLIIPLIIRKLKARTSRVQAHLISKDTCVYFSGNHFIMDCNDFKKKSLHIEIFSDLRSETQDFCND